MADFKKELRDAERQTRLIELQMRQECTHRSSSGSERRLVYLKDSERYGNNPQILQRYPASAVVCEGRDGCCAIFNADVYTAHDVSAMAFMMTSIFEQIKLMANLEQNEREELDTAMSMWTNDISGVLVFYKNMVNRLANNEKGNKNNNNRGSGKGKIGLPSTATSRNA